jgi:hypothetical protein
VKASGQGSRSAGIAEPDKILPARVQSNRRKKLLEIRLRNALDGQCQIVVHLM